MKYGVHIFVIFMSYKECSIAHPSCVWNLMIIILTLRHKHFNFDIYVIHFMYHIDENYCTFGWLPWGRGFIFILCPGHFRAPQRLQGNCFCYSCCMWSTGCRGMSSVYGNQGDNITVLCGSVWGLVWWCVTVRHLLYISSNCYPIFNVLACNFHVIVMHPNENGANS